MVGEAMCGMLLLLSLHPTALSKISAFVTAAKFVNLFNWVNEFRLVDWLRSSRDSAIIIHIKENKRRFLLVTNFI